jgi:8-amino-7-oxononanoate synthase
MSWTAWAEGELNEIRRADRWRSPVVFDSRGVQGTFRGRDVTIFSSNDYLGLSQHPTVREAAADAAQRFGAGATASRLVVGTRSLHAQLESEIAAWQGTERALVFPNGFAANLSVLSVLGGPDVTILSDELNHASIIDGCRLSKAVRKIYRHCDMEQLESLLTATTRRKLVVTDTVFSMDGDIAPVAAIASLCARHDALLVVDEAHAVLGPDLDDLPCELLRVGTLSKTLGSLGGWVAGSRSLIELLINRSRPFIFTTGLSPADTAAASAALRICISEEGDRLRAQLRRAVDLIAPAHPSPIIPVILGEDRAALRAAEFMLQHDLYVPAIRPPTVPPGTSRLRIALSAAHTEPMLEKLWQALQSLHGTAR